MLKILGHWEIGYHAPITEQYYRALPIRDFGLTDWNMIPKSGINNVEQGVNLTEWKNYEEFFETYPELTRVFLEPRTEHHNPDTTWLHDFKHPDDCVYVFGSAHYNPTLKHYRDTAITKSGKIYKDHIVTVKTEQDKGVLWADQALVVTLYDRMLKSWQ